MAISSPTPQFRLPFLHQGQRYRTSPLYEREHYDYIDRMPIHRLGLYRALIAPFDEGITQKLDERREREKSRQHIGIRTLLKGLFIIAAASPFAAIASSKIMNYLDTNNPTPFPVSGEIRLTSWQFAVRSKPATCSKATIRH